MGRDQNRNLRVGRPFPPSITLKHSQEPLPRSAAPGAPADGPVRTFPYAIFRELRGAEDGEISLAGEAVEIVSLKLGYKEKKTRER